MDIDLILNALVILMLQLVYVPLQTLRTTLVVKGERNKAPFVALIESIIYIICLGIVFSDLSNLYNIVAYVLGYSTGIYLGGTLEAKLAIGYRVIQIHITSNEDLLADKLRCHEFGATTFTGRGINDESRHRIDVLTHRNREKEVIDIAKSIDPKVFIVSYDLTRFTGGYLHKKN